MSSAPRPPASATYQKLVVIETTWIYEAAAHRRRCYVCSLLSEPLPISCGLQAENPRSVAHSKQGLLVGRGGRMSRPQVRTIVRTGLPGIHQLGCGPELRDRLQVLECRSASVRETPDGSAAGILRISARSKGHEQAGQGFASFESAVDERVRGRHGACQLVDRERRTAGICDLKDQMDLSGLIVCPVLSASMSQRRSEQLF